VSVGDLVARKKKTKFDMGLGLVVEVPYGLPNCIKVFWMDHKKYSPVMRSDLEVLSEVGDL
jgi:hypothetical protein